MKTILLFLLSASILFSCATSKNQLSTNTKGQQTEILPFSDKDEESSEDRIIDQPIYHASPTILTDLMHTKIEITPVWEKSELKGRVTITAKPHFYATDSLILHAQSMKINSISLDNKELNYKYTDDENLRIHLGKKYTRSQSYTIVIDYVARPEEITKEGSSAITDAKGLYFINPKGENKNQMPQIWTQGEPQSNSAWFPTIDRPNQKSSQEVFITVEKKYKTLSNGKLIAQKDNDNGTRTDYWKQELKHAPYLFMFAVGEFEVVEDSYTKQDGTTIPVDYYVEPEWKEDATAIFGETPEMIRYFSELLNIDFVWDKYSQIVVREYISGAMENSGAVVFGDFTYKTKRELIDANDQSVIAHELFHHWFGNLVTIESWSNLPLNESFANYSQFLWDEHRYGIEEAEYNAEDEANAYFQSVNQMGTHDMIWYDYDGIEDMFDAHSYNKGGRILHMLRIYLGDDAFFEGLHYYLDRNRFQTAEIANLRMAFEYVSGEDLNWFFNQWFFASNHPVLDVSIETNENEVTVAINQTQDLEVTPLYKLPMNIAVYSDGKKTSYPIVVDKSRNSFTFPFEGELNNVIVDENRATLAKFFVKKPREWYPFQYTHGSKYMDRKNAIIKGSRLRNEASDAMLLAALNDSFWGIRKLATSELENITSPNRETAIKRLFNSAENDSNSRVRSAAISALSKDFLTNNNKDDIRDLLIRRIEKDSSILVLTNALSQMAKMSNADAKEALKCAKSLENERSSSLITGIIDLYCAFGGKSNLDFVAESLVNGKVSGYNVFGGIFSFAGRLTKEDLETKEKYFSVFESLSKSGGAYVSRILPYALMIVFQSANEQYDEMQKTKAQFEKEGKTAEATRLELEIANANLYITKLQGLVQQLM